MFVSLRHEAMCQVILRPLLRDTRGRRRIHCFIKCLMSQTMMPKESQWHFLFILLFQQFIVRSQPLSTYYLSTLLVSIPNENTINIQFLGQ